ncbi:hypothetical protein [Escherichia coli]|uniref:hypothetical protein n=1 Tax=Escherichia coli TaxID=562 RepID=UPI0008FEF179|nr:hypothetical protein [Escherichia coli O157]MED7559800.1 hypothetical protein [Escherichia coli O157]
MAGRTRHNVSEKEKPQTRRMQDVLRLAGELSIVRVLNDFQPLPIYVFISEQTTRQQTPRYLSASPEQKF